MKKNDDKSSDRNPKTLIEAVRYFSDLDVAHDFFVRVRWADGVVCPQCGSHDARYLPKYRRFQCNKVHPRRQFTVKTGTVMEDSPLGLDKWAVAFWLEVNAKNSISSYEIHRALGITQKSAWFMLHRIRLAVQTGTFEKMAGIVEADETFIGGLARNMHKRERERKITGTGSTGKTAVMGLLARHNGERCSQVRATVVPNVQHQTLRDIIYQNFVDHAECYVKGAVHTNGLENFWALFKRCIKGTHVSIEPYHLFRYIDSESFRFNNRDFNDGRRFVLALRGMAGKRLTYKSLTGKTSLEGLAEIDSDGASESLPN